MPTRKKVAIANVVLSVLFALLSACVMLPALFTFLNSFMSPEEVMQNYQAVHSGIGQVRLRLLPKHPSLQAYYEVLLARPDYLIKFWNSIIMCAVILVGQIFVSCTAGFAFAKFKFRGQALLFFMFILLMMMPVQVTLLPNYITLNALSLLNTQFALILPAIFNPFGIFLMTQVFRGIPTELVKAATLDGASTWQTLCRVMIPAGKNGVIGLIILSFADNWNMVEQPVVFLKDKMMHPLSVFLAGMSKYNLSLSFVCGMLAILPVLLLFLFFKKEITLGIEFSGIK